MSIQSSTNLVLDKQTLHYIKLVLHECNIQFEDFSCLQGMVIPREILLRDDIYTSILESDTFSALKQHLSSSKITTFHKNADVKQKYPLLNFVRQLFKVIYYKMTPIRKSNGYDKTGKKLYIRMYKLEKIRVPPQYIVNIPITK